MNKAVKIRDLTSVNYGCSEKWNCPRVALQDAVGLDIARHQELSFEEIDKVIKTQGLQWRTRKSRDPPLRDFPILSFTFRHVEGLRFGGDFCMLERKVA